MVIPTVLTAFSPQKNQQKSMVLRHLPFASFTQILLPSATIASRFFRKMSVPWICEWQRNLCFSQYFVCEIYCRKNNTLPADFVCSLSFCLTLLYTIVFSLSISPLSPAWFLPLCCHTSIVYFS